MCRPRQQPSTAVYVFLTLSGFVALAAGLASGALLLGFGIAVMSWGMAYLFDLFEYQQK